MEITIRETNTKKYVFDTDRREYRLLTKKKGDDEWKQITQVWTEGEWFELQRFFCEKNRKKRNELSLLKAELTKKEQELSKREEMLNSITNILVKKTESVA